LLGAFNLIKSLEMKLRYYFLMQAY
jgi:hypothetical protein